jgi:anion-transporting  ArsA/GET3 family ATPase
MAKYKITGIPQVTPGGQDTWPPKFLRRKKKESFPTDPLLGSMPADPNIFDITTKEGFNRQQYLNQSLARPEVQVDPWDQQRWLTEQNMADEEAGLYEAPALPEEEVKSEPTYDAVEQIDFGPEFSSETKEELQALYDQKLWQEKLAQRETDFKKKNKFDKLDPLETIPLTEYQSRLNLNPEYENELKAQGYFINKNETTGNLELFPSNEIYTRIWNSGLRTDDITNKLGVGTKETVENYFGDFMGQADEYHEYQTKKAVLDLMEKEGYSLDNAVSYLANVKKLGTKKDLYNSYGKDFKEIENYAKAYIAYSDDYEKPYEKDQTTDLINRWADNDIITLARDREFIDSHSANIDVVSPNATGRLEWGAQILQALRSGKWGWKPKSNELIKLAADDTYKNLIVEPTSFDQALINNLKDYRTLEPQAYKKKYTPTVEQVQDEWKKGKVAVQIDETDEWRPNKMYAENADGTGGYYQYQFEVPAGKDPITGEIITRAATPDEMAGQTVYMTQEEADKYEKAMLADNMQDFQGSFLYNLPGTIAMGGLGLAGASRALAYAPIKSMPWLTGGNALNAYFAYEALKPQGQIQQAYEGFSEGDIGKGVENLIWGGLGVAPLIKPAANAFKAINEFKTAGSRTLLPTNSNYSFTFQSPLQQQLLIGNPQLGEASPVFKSFTDKLNKFTQYANIGEFQILKQNAATTGNLTNVGNQMLLGDMATIGQTVKNTTSGLTEALESSDDIVFYHGGLDKNATKQPLNIDQALAEEQALTTADDQLGIAGVSGITPEIESIYNSYPELSKIGTADEYAEYLKQTFPNSSAQDILYHVNRGDEVLTESGRPFYATQDKGWLYELEEMKGTRKPVLLNLENPTLLDQSYEFTDKAKEFRGSGLGSNLITPTEARLEGADGVIGRDMFQGEGGNTYVAFEPEQVLPLGTAKDAEMFKQWKASQSTGVSQESISTQAKQIVNKSDNEIAANVIDDMRNNKIELWQTEEGKRRLQLMIDNTPSLAGQTPETLVEGIMSMNNLNKVYGNQLKQREAIENEISNISVFYDEGKMSTEEYMRLVEPLENKLNNVNNAILETEQTFGNKAGFYAPKENQMFVSGDKFATGDLRKVGAHELGHYLGSFANKNAGVTYLDDQLKELTLIGGKSESKQLEFPGMGVVSEESKAHTLFGTANPNYLEETINYFKSGSKGTEKVPMTAELRQDLLDKGILKNEYDPITVDMLKKHYKNYKNLKGEKYPLRLYDIMENKSKNFNILKNVINALPIVAGGVATALNVANEEQEDGSVAQAGAPIMILAAFLSRNPKIQIPKQLRTLMADYGKKGLKALNTVNKVKYFNNQIKALAKENEELVKELGSFWPDDWPVDPSKKGLLAREMELGQLLNTKKRKFENYFEDKNRLIPKSRKMYERQQDINKYSNIRQNFVKTGEGLEQTQPSIYKGAVTTGEQVVTDFSTGEKIKAQVELPKVDVKYSIQDGELVVKDASTSEPVISQEYVNSLSNSKQKVETDIPGAIVFGSSVLVTEAGMPHITGDIDVLISESAYNNNVKNKFSFVQDYGPAKQHAVYPQYGQEGTLDFNIVHENPNGTVKPVWRKDVNTQEETSLEVELFRQFYPEQFQKASIESIKTGKPIEINMSTEEFMNGIDSKVKTVIDSYEATPLTKWGFYKSSKEKHIVRPDVLIEYGDPAVVAKGQEAYIKSIAGHKATLGHQFKAEDLSDPAKNMDVLIAMGFKGDDVVKVANDPARMQLALNDYYINMTTFTREIGTNTLPPTSDQIKTIENALTEWYPAAGGGSLNGMGLNTVRKGNPIHIYDTENAIIGHRQIGIKTDISNPEAYVKSINRATSGTYVYTPEEAKQVQEIFLKYLPQYKYQLDNIKESRDVLNLVIGNSDYTKGKLALNEMAETMGIRAIAKDADIITPTYGASKSQYASLFGNFDELVDSMLYSYKKYHATPKSGFQRKEKLESLISNKANTSSQISTVDDFNKINSIIDNGIKNANTRLSLIRNEYNALIVQQEALIDKFTKGAQTEYNAVKKRIEELQNRASEIYKERQILEDKKNKFKSKLQNVGIAVGAAGTLGGIYYLGQMPTQTEQELIDRGIDYELFTDDKNLTPLARRYIYNNPKAQVWPSGERIIIKNGLVIEPVSLVVRDGAVVFDPDYQMNEGITNKKQFGGDSNFLEMELTDEEIEDYIRKGYTVIEE